MSREKAWDLVFGITFGLFLVGTVLLSVFNDEPAVAAFNILTLAGINFLCMALIRQWNRHEWWSFLGLIVLVIFNFLLVIVVIDLTGDHESDKTLVFMELVGFDLFVFTGGISAAMLLPPFWRSFPKEHYFGPPPEEETENSASPAVLQKRTR